jgi:hypothetical protein
VPWSSSKRAPFDTADRGKSSNVKKAMARLLGRANTRRGQRIDDRQPSIREVVSCIATVSFYCENRPITAQMQSVLDRIRLNR